MELPPTDLPIEAIVAPLRAALGSKGVAVVVAPPGTGKTTVLPLRLMDEPWMGGRRITVLEPRRLATRAAARRMASLIGEHVGLTVGYVTREERVVSGETRVEVVTEGVLTRRIQRDPSLSGIGLVVFDEIHERNLQTDLGLALTVEARSAFRNDLRVLAMSATIQASRVAAVLGGTEPAAIIEATSTLHPIDIIWRPAARSGRSQRRRPGRLSADVDHAARVVREAISTTSGDVLAFLPGIREIDEVARRLEDVPAEVHRLHGSLPLEAQDAAIAPSAFPKVVLSTDIAESSLTVEGVSVVVDAGLARAPRFDVGTGMTRLRTISISRASADQRSGRAGRLGPGVAFRLWSKVEHGTRKTDIEPEITQVDLSGLVLETAAWGVIDPSNLPFLDAPPPRAVREAKELLRELSLLDETGTVTPMGRRAVGLPLHPRLAAMLLAVDQQDGQLAALLAALIDERDPIIGPWAELPVDLGQRIEAIAGISSSLRLDRRRADRIERVAADLARRASLAPGLAQPDRAGRVLAFAFPDRLAIRRGSAGRFQLRGGTTAWIPESDALAPEGFLVAAELDGKRKNARIRLAAALDRADVLDLFADAVEHSSSLEWRGTRLVLRTTSTIGGITLFESEQRPTADAQSTEMLIKRISSDGLGVLSWSEEALSLRNRVAFLRAVDGRWPDLSDEALRSSVAEWLGSGLSTAVSLDELAGVDLARLLRRRLGSLAGTLDQDAPLRLSMPNGRSVPVRYNRDGATIRARAQHLFGVRATPVIGGRPVTIEILSPADRPIQITSDLENFWSGSWLDVRKDMASRYPKHDWPESP